MERIKTIATRDLTKSVVTHNGLLRRRLRRVPDFLPVCLQDLLRRRKPEVREQQ